MMVGNWNNQQQMVTVKIIVTVMVIVIVVKVKVMVKEKYKYHDKNDSFMNIAEVHTNIQYLSLSKPKLMITTATKATLAIKKRNLKLYLRL